MIAGRTFSLSDPAEVSPSRMPFASRASDIVTPSFLRQIQSTPSATPEWAADALVNACDCSLLTQPGPKNADGYNIRGLAALEAVGICVPRVRETAAPTGAAASPHRRIAASATCSIINVLYPIVTIRDGHAHSSAHGHARGT